jgi:Tfp pilus assembly protein PilN
MQAQPIDSQPTRSSPPNLSFDMKLVTNPEIASALASPSFLLCSIESHSMQNIAKPYRDTEAVKRRIDKRQQEIMELELKKQELEQQKQQLEQAQLKLCAV